MAETGASGKKRKLAHPARKSVQSKRRKLQSAKQHKVSKPKRPVDVDALPWRSVDVPEMFDDAEGFFGLEEIEGVDVVRNGGTVQFIATVPSEADSEEFGGFGSPSPEPQNETGVSDIQPVQTKRKGLPAPTAGQGKTPGTGRKSSAIQEREEDHELGNVGFEVLRGVRQDEDETDVSAWMSLNLAPQLLSCIAGQKFAKPTPIQSAAIPEILAGRDVIGKASTGSGKTLAFAIPIVQKWLQERGVQPTSSATPIALILSPTRELAHQITGHIKDFCARLPAQPYVCSVTGGLSVYKQQRQLEKADVVVGTPGRLWEVLSSSKELLRTFKSIDFLVIDEADRLLTDGHFKEAEEIFGALDRTEMHEDDGESGSAEPSLPPRQTLVFSATFNKGLQQKLAGKGRYDLMDQKQSMEYLLKRLNFREEKPKFVDVNPVSQMAAGLREGLVECGAMEKDLFLYSVLLLQPRQRILVFTNSISSVRRITPMLQNLGLPALPLHSQMPQKARLRSVERFTGAKAGTASILVATDVAARGLDIPGIDVIVHYHVPRTADAYVHRSGRTARAEKSGASILLCAPDEVTPTRRLLSKIHSASAAQAGKNAGTGNSFVRTIDIDRRLVSRLKERLVLAKKIADAALAKEKGNKEENWMRAAADDLGVEYDSEELERAGKWGGRGSLRKSREKEAQGLSKAEVGALRGQLKALLAKRVNTGISEKYITSGNVDVDELLRGTRGEFLGKVDGLELDEV